MADIKDAIDFWMSDRAGDCSTFLDSLGVEEQKALKCCAHLILGVDSAVDKTFKFFEQKIGRHRLLDLSAGDRAFSGGNSIHTLGLIALAKLLSPSHASQSVSLYNEFKQWLLHNRYIATKFKGFISNRFGRIAELSKEFHNNQSLIKQFFEDVVDENANKLVLAVATYIQNDWFAMCCKL